MKIIAKYKDYYDYLAGIYGIDDLLVYDRRDGANILPEYDSYFNYTIAFCGNLYNMVYHLGKFYHTISDFEQLWNMIINDRAAKSNAHLTFGVYGYMRRGKIHFPSPKVEKKAMVLPTNINKKLREPILVKSCKWVKPISLQELGFAKVKSAHEVYTEMSNFLGWLVDNPPLPDNQTDKEKVVSHGFDLKKSFRHRL